MHFSNQLFCSILYQMQPVHSQIDPLSKIDWSKIVRDVVSNGEASIICYARINDGNHYTKMTGVLEGYMLADGRICDLMAAKESVL